MSKTLAPILPLQSYRPFTCSVADSLSSSHSVSGSQSEGWDLSRLHSFWKGGTTRQIDISLNNCTDLYFYLLLFDERFSTDYSVLSSVKYWSNSFWKQLLCELPVLMLDNDLLQSILSFRAPPSFVPNGSSIKTTVSPRQLFKASQRFLFPPNFSALAFSVTSWLPLLSLLITKLKA